MGPTPQLKHWTNSGQKTVCPLFVHCNIDKMWINRIPKWINSGQNNRLLALCKGIYPPFVDNHRLSTICPRFIFIHYLSTLELWIYPPFVHVCVHCLSTLVYPPFVDSHRLSNIYPRKSFIHHLSTHITAVSFYPLFIHLAIYPLFIH